MEFLIQKQFLKHTLQIVIQMIAMEMDLLLVKEIVMMIMEEFILVQMRYLMGLTTIVIMLLIIIQEAESY